MNPTVQLIKKDSSAIDAVKLIQVMAWQERDSAAVQKLLKAIPFQPRLSWFEQMFWHIDSLTDYKYDDPGREQIKTPDRLLHDAVGDCDDFTGLWLAILNNVDVEAQPKIVDYEGDGYWDHIYAIVPVKNRDYLVLDNVAGKFRGTFNVEVERDKEKVFRPYKP
jgi:transglutaminase-like putative cysteine protease